MSLYRQQVDLNLLHTMQARYRNYGMNLGCGNLQYQAKSFTLLVSLEVSIAMINEDTKLEKLECIKGKLIELMPLLSKWP